MTAVHQLLSRCRRVGVELLAGPDGALTVESDGDPPADLLADLRRNKAELLQLLAGASADAPPVEPRNDAEADALCRRAIEAHERAGWPDDADACRRRGETMDRIDAAYLGRDLAGLRKAVADFLAALPPPPSPDPNRPPFVDGPGCGFC